MSRHPHTPVGSASPALPASLWRAAPTRAGQPLRTRTAARRKVTKVTPDGPRLSRRALLAAVGLLAVSCRTTSPTRGATTSPATSPTTNSATKAGVIDPGDGGNYAPVLDPANFVEGIDNPYMPLIPGSSWVYEGTADGQREHTQVVVTSQRRAVMGIPAVVVRDTVTLAEAGSVEVSIDWFAQDRSGDVWSLGEDFKAYEGGKVVSTEGSWEAGVDGARPGIVMRAAPAVGDAYRRQFNPGKAEELAQVIRVGATASVPAGNYHEVIVIKEWTPLEPEAIEEKSYAPGVGKVFEVGVAGGQRRLELTKFTPGSR